MSTFIVRLHRCSYLFCFAPLVSHNKTMANDDGNEDVVDEDDDAEKVCCSHTRARARSDHVALHKIIHDNKQSLLLSLLLPFAAYDIAYTHHFPPPPSLCSLLFHFYLGPYSLANRLVACHELCCCYTLVIIKRCLRFHFFFWIKMARSNWLMHTHTQHTHLQAHTNCCRIL